MGFIKVITGNDEIELRRLYSNKMIKYKANFKVLLACNDIPEVNGNIDYAFTRRLRCINFPTIFKDNPTKENEKLIDMELKAELKEFKNDLMLILIEYYDKFIENGLKPTPNILKWTNQYKTDNDLYLTYINENIEIYKDKEGMKRYRIFYDNLYDDFKSWHNENNPGKTPPNSGEFKKGMSRHVEIKKCVRIENKLRSGVEGVRFKSND